MSVRLSHLNLNKNELQNAVIQPLATAPGSPVEGQVYYNTVDDTVYVWANGAWLDMGVQGGAGATDLSQTLTSTTVTINSNTGADTIIAAADGTNAGVMTSAQSTKLAGIATGATANDTDANLKARANHTGTQTASTISDFAATVSANTDVAANTAARHTHSNATVLNNTTASFTTADETKLDAIEALADVTDAGNVGTAINGSTAKATPVAADKIALIDTAASNVLKHVTYQNLSNAVMALITDSAPTSLDTLNELAAALGDDPNFATTVSTSLGEKMVKTANLSDVANAATAFTNIKQAATTSATGVVELATQAEAQAKTDTTRALTAASVADFARKYTGTIGNGSLTSIPVTHGLGSQYVTAQVFDATSNAMVECDVVLTSSTVTTFTFNVAPTTNQYRVVITG